MTDKKTKEGRIGGEGRDQRHRWNVVGEQGREWRGEEMGSVTGVEGCR